VIEEVAEASTSIPSWWQIQKGDCNKGRRRSEDSSGNVKNHSSSP